MLIILGIIIYIIIGIFVFYMFSKYDVLNEYWGMGNWKQVTFPTKTFSASVFWVIAIPLLIVCVILGAIAEWIETTGYVIREVEEHKQREKRLKQIPEEEKNKISID